MAIRRLTLVVNRTKPGVDDIVRAVQDAAQKAGVTLTVADSWPISRATLKGADACGVVGGDGTFLGVAEAAAAGYDGTGVKVAVIDFQMNPDVPQFSTTNVTIHNPSFCADFPDAKKTVKATTTDYDAGYHGNDMVGLIGGNGIGNGDGTWVGFRVGTGDGASDGPPVG